MIQLGIFWISNAISANTRRKTKAYGTGSRHPLEMQANLQVSISDLRLTSNFAIYAYENGSRYVILFCLAFASYYRAIVLMPNFFCSPETFISRFRVPSPQILPKFRFPNIFVSRDMGRRLVEILRKTENAHVRYDRT